MGEGEKLADEAHREELDAEDDGQHAEEQEGPRPDRVPLEPQDRQVGADGEPASPSSRPKRPNKCMGLRE